jgi:hypothetical protein
MEIIPEPLTAKELEIDPVAARQGVGSRQLGPERIGAVGRSRAARERDRAEKTSSKGNASHGRDQLDAEGTEA